MYENLKITNYSKLKKKKNFLFKKLTFLLIFVFFLSILLNYSCSEKSCFIDNIDDKKIKKKNSFFSKKKWLNESNRKKISKVNYLNLNRKNEKKINLLNLMSFDHILKNDTFDLKRNDVIVFLHIQKTGGTSFGKRLVLDLNLKKPCYCFKHRKNCNCIRPNYLEINQDDKNISNKNLNLSKNWLLSRYSTGWICGLHADWSQLNYCAQDALNLLENNKIERNFFFITLLREPISRFLSEYSHFKRGATWEKSKYACYDETLITKNCNNYKNLKDFSLIDYMKCDKNLAINRQTKMLANLSEIGCINQNTNLTAYNEILLDSAKKNLLKMAFFGLLEFQKISQFIFERTFNITFFHSFIQLNKTHSSLIEQQIDNNTLEQVQKLNYLDIRLYNFAREILFERFNLLKKNYNFEYFETSKLDAVKNIQKNIDNFPELKLLNKFVDKKV